MPDELEKSFVKSLLIFFKRQARKQEPDVAESIEVAIQCLEAAYDITTEAPPEPTQSEPNSDDGAVGGTPTENPLDKMDLFEMFQSTAVSVTPERKTLAEEVKNEGNRLMKEGKYNEALLQYNRAISLDATNPVFYCNRAAAYIRLNEFEKSIADCKMSLIYNPSYSKAHGRMGIAYSNLQKYEDARQAYKRALQIEPNNQDYQNNMRLCEDRLIQSSQRISQQFLTNLPEDTGDLRHLINEMLHDPMISAASRQLVVQMASEYPEFFSGFRQQLINFTTAASRHMPQDDVETANRFSATPTFIPGIRQQLIAAAQQSAELARQNNNSGINGVVGGGGGGNPGTESVPQDDLNIDLDELRRIHEREGHVADVVRRPPVHQRQPLPRPGPEEMVQQMATAAGAAPHYEELPPSDGPNIRGGGGGGAAAAAPPPQQGHTPRSDGGGDEQSSD